MTNYQARNKTVIALLGQDIVYANTNQSDGRSWPFTRIGRATDERSRSRSRYIFPRVGAGAARTFHPEPVPEQEPTGVPEPNLLTYLSKLICLARLYETHPNNF